MIRTGCGYALLIVPAVVFAFSVDPRLWAVAPSLPVLAIVGHRILMESDSRWTIPGSPGS